MRHDPARWSSGGYALSFGLVLRVAVACGILVSGSVYASAETRYALLFGVNNYPNLGPKFTLQKAVNDAANLGDELRAMHFQVDVVPNPTYQDMLSKIVTLASRIQLGDTVLVFFSGHGVSPD